MNPFGSIKNFTKVLLNLALNELFLWINHNFSPRIKNGPIARAILLLLTPRKGSMVDYAAVLGPTTLDFCTLLPLALVAVTSQ